MAEPAHETDEPRELSYAEFGRRFFETAVTKERVLEAVGDVAGRPIDVGPMGVGPLNLVKVTAHGAVGQPDVARRPHPELIAYDLTIPARVRLEIQIGPESYHFDADTTIHLVVTARALEPLQIYMDVQPPQPDDVDVALEANGLRASVLDKLAGVEREVQRSVAKFVGKQIAKSADHRVVDVARKIG
jgi:hypothetical protein